MPAREFVVYIALLVAFMMVVGHQYIETDFAINDGLQGMCGMVQFRKISTQDDYVAWWPVLFTAMQQWNRNADPALDAGRKNLAVLVGMPLITQKRRTDGPNFLSSAALPRFNATNGQPCVWPLGGPSQRVCTDDATGALNSLTSVGGLTGGMSCSDYLGDVQVWSSGGCAFDLSSLDPLAQVVPAGTHLADICPVSCRTCGNSTTTEVSTENAACYQSSVEVPDHGLVYFVPEIKMMLNGTISGWNPADWIDQDTEELAHMITLYMPTTRRFATIDISLSFDITGRLTLYSSAGASPQFHAHETFQVDTDPAEFWGEMMFYLVIFWFMFGELGEIWDCICLTDTLLPLEILADALQLSLLEVQHAHEMTTEVYDPRNPTTGEAFRFPDLEDIQVHYEQYIKTKETTAKELVDELQQLKEAMALESKSSMSSLNDLESHEQMIDLQRKMMLHDVDLKMEIELSETAAALQLSVMWVNKWSMDFPDEYLDELAKQSDIPDDGLEAYCKVDWIQVARDYIVWKAGAHTPPHNGVLVHHFRASRIFHKHGEHIRASKKSYVPQERHFANLVTFVDYLKMVRSVLTLHSNVVVARGIKHWGGPRGKEVQMSNTCERAFQVLIDKYNETGTNVLRQMEKFPDEIVEGFHTPNTMKAETVVIKASAVNARLARNITAASVLGFFFPGSPLWELRRRLRKANLFTKSESFWKSLKVLSKGTKGLGLVSSISMTLYVQADDVHVDPDLVSPQKAPAAPKAKKKKGSSETALSTSNPLHSMGVDDDSDEDTPDGTMKDPKKSGDFSPSFKSVATAAKVSPRMLGLPKQETVDMRMGVADTDGMQDWQRLLTFHMRSLVNMDGQFIVDQTSNVAGSFGLIPLLFPLLLWVRYGLSTYSADMWNSIEFVTYLMFIVAFYCKVKMGLAAALIDDQYAAVMAGQEDHMSLLDEFHVLNGWYMFTMMPNGLLMWVKLFKYVDVFPQMGVLIKVLQKAIGPVLIFTLTAMIPCVGLALSYHAKFGASVKHYSTVSGSLNTLMRMAVGVSVPPQSQCAVFCAFGWLLTPPCFVGDRISIMRSFTLPIPMLRFHCFGSALCCWYSCW